VCCTWDIEALIVLNADEWHMFVFLWFLAVSWRAEKEQTIAWDTWHKRADNHWVTDKDQRTHESNFVFSSNLYYFFAQFISQGKLKFRVKLCKCVYSVLLINNIPSHFIETVQKSSEWISEEVGLQVGVENWQRWCRRDMGQQRVTLSQRVIDTSSGDWRSSITDSWQWTGSDDLDPDCVNNNLQLARH